MWTIAFKNGQKIASDWASPMLMKFISPKNEPMMFAIANQELRENGSFEFVDNNDVILIRGK